MTELTRREMLKLGGFGAGVTALGLTVPLGETASTSDWISTSAKPARFARRLPIPVPVTPTPMTDEHGDYLLYEITEQSTSTQLLDPGAPLTQVFGYAAAGAAPTVPGPLIKVDQNTRVRLRVSNDLPPIHPTFGYEVATSVHLHGSASLPQYDGYADDLTGPGQAKDYWYPNHQGPRTMWYHDHGAHQTATNVYSGLVAQYHVQNPWEKENLPQGKYDVPLTIGDAMFAKNGSLAYMDRDHNGLYGDVITVNGVPWPFFEVERRFYRFRILMATLSRSMNLRFVNTRTGATLPAFVVATDGGLTTPQPITSWRHGGAERYEIMVDFAGCRIGDRVELRNSSNKNNRDFIHTGKVLQLRVTSEPTDTRWNSVPTPPSSELHEVMSAPRSAALRTRDIDLEHDDETNVFMINGMTWEEVRDAGWNVFTDESGSPPRPGDYEIWRIENNSGGWFHPMHIHLVDFRILSRRGGSGRVQPWEKGPKDVVYVGEGEEIEVLVHYAMPPAQYPDGRSTGQAGANGHLGGRYMIHCHNLAHEDHDMMGQFVVAAADGTVDLSSGAPNHPVYAAPPQ
ncbi:bilirubin oxidase [Knoellia sinensis KCTC 19936]|uniref:Bilirubin oxidase n=1 Tax=Knoellia sinensis KCTC 19936 TaxID=1385520 RepID=A0A0A0J0P9_9MICO|nr:multicopper oxidase domain-containing protein [Knoellia sinensis]KGN30299.1 bilirubin oxidase [Knoellia sinensis KCTC 19936]